MKKQDNRREAPASALVNQNTNNNTVSTRPAMTSDVGDIGQESVALGYPMSMPSATDTDRNSNVAIATENGEFEPVQTSAEMSSFRNTGEPSPNDELFSDTIS